MGDKVKVSFQLTKELRAAAKAKAEAEDVSLSQAIRWYLMAWVRGDIGPLPPGAERAET